MKEPIPIGIDFTPNWWHRNYEISFAERYYRDPEYRLAAQEKMASTLHERFGDLGLGAAKPAPNPTIEYGMVMLPAVFGCEILFVDNAYPIAAPLNLTAEEIGRLTMPELEQSAPMRDLIRQMEYYEERFGHFVDALSPTGVLNLALALRGKALYTDFYEQPDLAKAVLRVCLHAVVTLVRYKRERVGANLKRHGKPTEHGIWFVPNCSLALISRSTYEDYLLECDQCMAKLFRPFGLHLCGRADELLGSFARIPELEWVDFAASTNLALIRKHLPNIKVHLTLEPQSLLRAKPEEVKAVVEEILSEMTGLPELALGIPSVEYGMPDENVRMVYQTVRAYRPAGVSPDRG